jgi:TrmH family RNA methyltransferase
VGAVLRSALAFGAASVALGPRCADPFAPKSVRASMGAIFAVPVAQALTVDALPGRKVALVPGTGSALAGPIHGSVTILLGAERSGLPDAVLRECDEVRHIPLAAPAQSLNVAMAATVALYELTRAGAHTPTSTEHRMARR